MGEGESQGRGGSLWEASDGVVPLIAALWEKAFEEHNTEQRASSVAPRTEIYADDFPSDGFSSPIPSPSTSYSPPVFILPLCFPSGFSSILRPTTLQHPLFALPFPPSNKFFFFSPRIPPHSHFSPQSSSFHLFIPKEWHPIPIPYWLYIFITIAEVMILYIYYS